MNNGFAYLLVLTLTLLAPLAQTAHANSPDTDLRYMTLNGLESIAVSVDGVRAEFRNLGLNPQAIRDSVSATLREHGIVVIESGALTGTPGAALMRVKINMNENQYRFYFYGVSVELRQKIPLHNPAGGYITETIWQEGQTGIVMPTELRKLNHIIAGLLEGFVKEYRAQNPGVASAAAR